MTKENLSPQLKENNYSSIVEILSNIDDIKLEYIKKFQENKILQDQITQKIFNNMTENNQKIAIVIDRLPDDQIKKIIEYTKNKKIVGIHEIRSHLLALYNLTKNQKYKFYL